jgi:hypothetical protein
VGRAGSTRFGQPNRRFRQGIAIGVGDGTDRGDETLEQESLPEVHGGVLRASSEWWIIWPCKGLPVMMASGLTAVVITALTSAEKAEIRELKRKNAELERTVR